MSSYEYTAIPAPMRSEKSKSAKTPADRYAATLTEAINKMAGEGWEYLRAETLPSEERSGLTGRTTLFHNLLIFRREIAASRMAEAPAATPVDTPAPAPRAAMPQPEASPPQALAPTAQPAAADQPVQPAASPVFSEKMRVAEQPGHDKTIIETVPRPKPAG